mmetsp:Transcript_24347/g.30212  ORF Transcript_24347/g.30212 Transcript_24347/m.30212 type:complete len:115 (-) Transcript_24347:97-441(-)
MLQALTPKPATFMTYVVATDQCCSVRQFCSKVYSLIGFKDLEWTGEGLSEKLTASLPGTNPTAPRIMLVEIDSALFRPGEVPYLRGDATKIKNDIAWKASTLFDELVAEMVSYQ